MNEWEISWTVSSHVCAPASNALVTGNLLNSGASDFSLDEITLRTDWQQGEWYYQQIGRILRPNQRHFFSFSIPIPQDVIGARTFNLGAVTRDAFTQFVLNGYGYSPSPIFGIAQHYEASQSGSFNVQPMPLYNAFVSRSVHENDAPILEPIVRSIAEWGFAPHTVGIDIFTEIANVPNAVRQSIINSDCVIAIATKRDLSAVTGLWKTLEWLHGEVGIAFGVDKPVFVLADYEVQLGGLPASIRSWQLPFDVNNLQAVSRDLAKRMPQFRKEIAVKKSRDFWNRVVRVGAPLALGFVLGAAAFGSKSSKS